MVHMDLWTILINFIYLIFLINMDGIPILISLMFVAEALNRLTPDTQSIQYVKDNFQ